MRSNIYDCVKVPQLFSGRAEHCRLNRCEQKYCDLLKSEIETLIVLDTTLQVTERLMEVQS